MPKFQSREVVVVASAMSLAGSGAQPFEDYVDPAKDLIDRTPDIIVALDLLVETARPGGEQIAHRIIPGASARVYAGLRARIEYLLNERIDERVDARLANRNGGG